VQHVVVLVGDRQHQHPREWREAVDLADRLDAGHAGHVQVHHDHIGCELAHEAHGVGALACLAGDLHAALLEQVAQAGPEEIVIVDKQHANAARCPLALELHGFAHNHPPWSGEKSSQCSEIVTVRRPQARACATVENQRSIVGPWTAEPVSAATPEP
jgi:hypothetical protein